MSLIRNGKDIPLNTQQGTVPQMGDALLSYFQPMTFEVITKTNNESTGFQVVETTVPVSFQGVWQPYNNRVLKQQPEGQRSWNSFQVHADPTLQLNTDDVLKYLGVQYRVQERRDYRLYAYMHYILIQDYTGAGPTEVEA